MERWRGSTVSPESGVLLNGPEPTASRRSPRSWALEVALCGLLCLLASAQAWLGFRPPALLAEVGGVEPFGAGSDWDRQWVMARVGAAAHEQGLSPEWDPFTGAGSPLRSNPESFVGHPAFRAASADGPGRALLALVAWSAAVLVAGSAALAARLAGGALGAAIVGAALGVAALHIQELRSRLFAGHLMVLGALSWPMALAFLLGPGAGAGRMDVDDSVPPRRTTAPGAWAAGAVLGLAATGGAHYPLMVGALLLGLCIWADLARPRAPLALPVVLLLPLLPWGDATWRRPVAAVVAIVLLYGVSDLRRFGAVLLRCVAVLGGILAVAGPKVVAARELLQWSPRSGLRDEASYRVDVPPLTDWIDGGEPILDGAMAVGPLGVGLALAGAVVGRRNPLVPAALALSLLGLGAGRAADPWFFLSRLPGLQLLDYPGRLQWALLPLALMVVVPLVTAGRAVRRAVAAAALLGAVGGLLTLRLSDPTLPDGRDTPGAAARVVGATADPSQKLSAAAGAGVMTIRGDLAVALERPEPWPGDLGAGVLAVSGGRPIDATLGLGGVTLPPLASGATFMVAQRSFPGWTCTGADLVAPRWTDERRPRLDVRWLEGISRGAGPIRCEREALRGRDGLLLTVLGLLGGALSFIGPRIAAVLRARRPA